MSEIDFLNENDKPIVPGRKNRDGYKVVYPDGYVSWSPKKVFEEAYREVNEEEIELLVDRA